MVGVLEGLLGGRQGRGMMVHPITGAPFVYVSARVAPWQLNKAEKPCISIMPSSPPAPPTLPAGACLLPPRL